MKKTKQILAILGIVILVGLYVTTLLAAIFGENGADSKLFMVSLAATFLVPLILWMFLWYIGKATGKRNITSAPEIEGLEEALRAKEEAETVYTDEDIPSENSVEKCTDSDNV